MDLHQKAGDALKEWLLKYDWEWFCTLSLPVRADCAKAEEKLKKWRIKMGISHHILFAYMGVFNTVPQPHIHLLALGKRNKFGQTLLDILPKRWEHEWSTLNKYKDVQNGSRLITCTTKIEPVDKRGNIDDYIAKKNLPLGRSELIQPYNKRLLDKAMIG
jgi:hypothetical protein